MGERLIRLRFSTIDHFAETRRFKTVKGAAAYAVRRIGKVFDADTALNGYAVDNFGVAKIVILEGTTWAELRTAADHQGFS